MTVVTSPQPLPANAVAAFASTGFVVAKALIESQSIDRFTGDLERIVEAVLTNRGLPTCRDGGDVLHRNLAMVHDHDQELYVAMLRSFNRLRSAYDLFLQPSVAQACSQLGVRVAMQHTLPIFHIMSEALRIADGYHGFEAHQDWSGLQSSLNTVVVWIPLHDIDRSRFPLEVLPGSHADGLCAAVQADADVTRFVPTRKYEQVEVQKGDAVFMSPFTIHRTGMSDTNALRLAVSWRYEDAIEPTFVDRRFPFAQTRSVRHELILPDFPGNAQMKRVFDYPEDF